MVPTPGTWGYYIDGWCDIISETALIYSVGVIILKEKIRLALCNPKQAEDGFISKCSAPLSLSIWGLGVQSIVSAVGWNWTTTQLHLLLETHGDSVNTQVLSSPSCWLVVFFWRLLNPHMLTQALLVSLVVDRCDTWVQLTRYLITVPVLTLCAISYCLVYKLRQDLG